MILARQNLHFLDQAESLLSGLDDQRFTAGDCHGHSSTGAHLRHTLDAYRCFLEGLADNRIDYDARQRDLLVETDRAVALERVAQVKKDLARLTESDRHMRVAVRSDAAAWDGSNAWTRSTLGRELQFLLSHTVHHFALIAMTLRGLDFEPGPDFGIAPSTLEHQESQEIVAEPSEASLCAP